MELVKERAQLRPLELARLAELVTPFNAGFQLTPNAYLDPSSQQGIAMIDRMVTGQAATIAYQNDFLLMMWISLAAYPLWYANYTTKPPATLPGGWNTWTMWQYTSTAAVPGMRQRGAGWILSISSTQAGPRKGPPFAPNSTFGACLYGGTKAMIDRITTGAAMDLYDDNIAVNTLAPEYSIATENALTVPGVMVMVADSTAIAKASMTQASRSPMPGAEIGWTIAAVPRIPRMLKMFEPTPPVPQVSTIPCRVERIGVMFRRIT